MLSRISLAAAVAVFMASGCASKGNDQNYRVLEEDQERFETEPNSMSDAPVVYGQFSAEPRSTVRTDDESREQSRVFEVETNATTIQDAAPSLAGLDRSQWESVEIHPHRRTMTVQRHYFEDYTTYASRPGRPTLPVQSDEQVLVTLGPAEADNLSARNLFDMVAQPVELAFDLVLFPARLVLTPPWTNVADETLGHGTTYFEGSKREPVPAPTRVSQLRSLPTKATVEVIETPAPAMEDAPAADEATMMEAAEEKAIATEPME